MVMQLTEQQMFRALMNTDKSFDHAFYTGVTSTHIYCRSVCTAKKPLAKNVRFFRLRSEAVGNGFRACKRCKPDTLNIVQTKIAIPSNCDFDWILSFLKLRAVAGIEDVGSHSYKRSLRTENGPITLEIVKSGNSLACRALGKLNASQLRDLVAEMFDLDADMQDFYKSVSPSKSLSSLVQRRPGLRLPLYLDTFEGAIRAILGQQVSVAGARTTIGLLVEKFGDYAPSLDGETLRLFPTSQQLSEVSFSSLQSIGLTRAKTETIRLMAKVIADGSLDLMQLKSNASVADEALQNMKGIGPWTAAYIRMRVLGDRDAFPANDLGVLKALNFPEKKKLKEMTDSWSPWRAYATLHLWNSLDLKAPNAQLPNGGTPKCLQ